MRTGLAIVAGGSAVGIAFIFLFIYYDNTSHNDKPHNLVLAIDGLSKQYVIGQKIDFAVTAKGYDHLCSYPSVQIENRDSGKIVYENSNLIYLGLCDPDARVIDETWNISRLVAENDHTDFTIKEAGNYQLIANYGEETVAHDFRVVKPQAVNVSIVKDDVLQANAIKFEPKRISVVLGVNNTVTWVNKADVYSSIVGGNKLDSDFFKATNYDGKPTKESRLYPNDSFEFTFTKAGKYNYFSVPQTGVRGIVIVIDNSSANFDNYPNEVQCNESTLCTFQLMANNTVYPINFRMNGIVT